MGGVGCGGGGLTKGLVPGPGGGHGLAIALMNWRVGLGRLRGEIVGVRGLVAGLGAMAACEWDIGLVAAGGGH